MTNSSTPYSDAIFQIVRLLPENGQLAAPQASARKTSRVCGSTVGVDLVVENGVVSAYAHRVNACALGQSSASVVARAIVGTPVAEMRRVRDEMDAMLKRKGPPPEGARWGELKYLETVRDYPARHASTLLVFEAVVDCLDQIAGQG